MTEKLDEKDFVILDELKKNSKLSEKKLARKTNIPMTTIHNRIKKLRELKIIENFTVKVNYEKLGKSLIAFILLKTMPGVDQKIMLNEIGKMPGIYEVAMITGEFDLLFKARVSSMEELNKIVVQNLRKDKRVGETVTMVCYELIEIV